MKTPLYASWEIGGAVVPEPFSSARAFWKATVLGIAITVTQYGVFILLISKPWQ